MKYLSAIVLICVCVSCSRKTLPSASVERKDSVSVSEKITYRDTFVMIPADTAGIMAMVKCPDGAKPTMQMITGHGRHSTISVDINNGLLRATSSRDSLTVKLQNTEKERDYYREKSSTLKETTVEKERYVPGFVKALAWIGGLVSAGAVGWCVYKLGKISVI